MLDACVSSGIEAELSSDIERGTWEKSVFLVGLLVTATAVRQPIGVIRSDVHSRELLRDVMAEAVSVGSADGVMPNPEFSVERLAFCDTLPAVMTSLMRDDLTQGNRRVRPLLSGGVVDLGREFGIPTLRKRGVGSRP
ncbi:ketopantoate reductase family protein [Streptomyces mirabilis]|uniref:ketopantoate reductase family protein n=1 Tax=Streptomyces mirabilis TaxID=68239 RepID=UPI00371CCB6E